MYKCKKCGREYEGNFCPDCGEKRTGNFCPNCGSELEEGRNFCPNCGYKLEKTSPLNIIKARRLSAFLSVLPIVITFLCAYIGFMALSYNMIDGIDITFFEEWRYKDYSGIDGLGTAAGAIFALSAAEVIIAALSILFRYVRSLSTGSVRIFGRKCGAGLLVQFSAAAFLAAQFIAYACGIASINGADEGMGLLKPTSWLKIGLGFTVVSFAVVSACVIINEFVVLRRYPEARKDFAYRADLKQFASSVPAPETKERPELYAIAVKHYSLKNAALCCIFMIAAALVVIAARFVARNGAAFETGVIISAVLTAIGAAAFVLSVFISRGQASKRIKTTDNVNKMLKKGGLYKAVCILTSVFTFFAFCLSLMTGTGAGKVAGVINIICCVCGAVLSVLMFLNHSTLFSLLYGVGKGLKGKAGITNMSCNEEEFAKQITAYDEYREYVRLMAIYNYKAHLYAKAKKKNADFDGKESEIASITPNKARVWLYKYGAYIAICVAAVLIICAISVIAALGGTAPTPEKPLF